MTPTDRPDETEDLNTLADTQRGTYDSDGAYERIQGRLDELAATKRALARATAELAEWERLHPVAESFGVQPSREGD